MANNDCSMMNKSEPDFQHAHIIEELSSNERDEFKNGKISTSTINIKVANKVQTDKCVTSVMKFQAFNDGQASNTTNWNMSRSAHNLQLNNLSNGFNQEHLSREKKISSSEINSEILETMDAICRMVKTNQLNPLINTHIFSLYDYLKEKGESLELTRKSEMNQVFVAIRQACCRDAGQLGTPCRLKMMELIELRALKWRPSLPHSQYYVEKQCSDGQQTPVLLRRQQPLPLDFCQLTPQQQPTTPKNRCQPTTPASAPPFGTVPINPFSFGFRPHASPVVSPADMLAAAAVASSPPSPSYYLIPATPHGATFMQSPTAGAGLLPTPGAQALLHAQHLIGRGGGFGMTLNPFAAGLAAAVAAEFPKCPLMNFPQLTRVPMKNQFRDEIVIRNADSGKIMGVKGRRVSIIEEFSNSIISFQKVAQNAKERTLTITGHNEESILHAKLLIEDTIRRNVSPTREGHNLSELKMRRENDCLQDDENEDDEAFVEGMCASEVECALSEMGSVLKLSCADPQVLKVARQALKDYFKRRDLPASVRGMSESYRYATVYNKERRKSMPLPLNRLDDLMERKESGSETQKLPTEDSNEIDNSNAHWMYNARSTPNLLAGFSRFIMKHARSSDNDDNNSVQAESNRPRIVYTRDFLLKFYKCSENMPEMFDESAEGIKEIFHAKPRTFDVIAYKKKFSDLNVIRF